jgi:predicted nucleic acid-binding protein
VIHLDTSYLVDLLREAERSARPSVERNRVAKLCSGLHLAVPGAGFAEAFGSLYATLARRGALVATMDLLIATAAVQARASLLTRNVRHSPTSPAWTS